MKTAFYISDTTTRTFTAIIRAGLVMLQEHLPLKTRLDLERWIAESESAACGALHHEEGELATHHWEHDGKAMTCSSCGQVSGAAEMIAAVQALLEGADALEGLLLEQVERAMSDEFTEEIFDRWVSLYDAARSIRRRVK